ncbi:MAG: prepilin peptidase [Pseudomonadota bacterium]
MGAFEALVTLVVAAPFAIGAAYYDLKTMEIPNWLSGGAALVFAALVFATLPLDDALWRLAGGAIVLVVCFGLFAVGQMGPGDGKTAAAFALLVAPRDAPSALVILSMAALILLLVILGLRRTSLADGSWRFWRDKHLPYGVALGAALLIYLTLVLSVVS